MFILRGIRPYIWLTVMCMLCFSARLNINATIVCVWASTIMLFMLGQFLFDRRAAFLSSLFLCSSFGVFYEVYDKSIFIKEYPFYITGLLSLSLLYLKYKFSRDIPNHFFSKDWFLSTLFWISMTVLLLLSGFISHLFIIVSVTSLIIWDKDYKWLKKTKPILGVLFFSLSIFWWYMLKGELPFSFNVEYESRIFGFYSLALLIFFWPASLFLLPSLITGYRNQHIPSTRYLLASLIPSIIIFEIIPYKNSSLLIFFIPQLSLLVGIGIASIWQTTESIFGSKLARSWYFFWFLLTIGLEIYGIYLHSFNDSLYLILTGILMLIGTIYSLLCLKFLQYFKAAVWISLMSSFCFFVLLNFTEFLK